MEAIHHLILSQLTTNFTILLWVTPDDDLTCQEEHSSREKVKLGSLNSECFPIKSTSEQQENWANLTVMCEQEVHKLHLPIKGRDTLV